MVHNNGLETPMPKVKPPHECENCVYWVKQFDQCRRMPPHPEYGWPDTDFDHWCGEFKPRGENG